jgi:hypothetical protein
MKAIAYAVLACLGVAFFAGSFGRGRAAGRTGTAEEKESP